MCGPGPPNLLAYYITNQYVGNEIINQCVVNNSIDVENTTIGSKTLQCAKAQYTVSPSELISIKAPSNSLI